MLDFKRFWNLVLTTRYRIHASAVPGDVPHYSGVDIVYPIGRGQGIIVVGRV